MDKRSRALVVLIVGTSLTAAALILSIPPLFGPHQPAQAWLTAVLAALLVPLAAGTLYLRPRGPRSWDPNADE